MKKTIVLLAFTGMLATSLAQTPAGKSFYKPTTASNVYIDCGNSNLLNGGSTLTLEAWILPYEDIIYSDFNEKIMGKTDNVKAPGVFSNGYMLGINNNIYGELWQDDANTTYNNIQAGNIPYDTGWVHIAMTYAAGDSMAAYINGQLVSKVPVTPGTASGIGSCTTDFVIGIAPWDFASYEVYGYLDEVRVWNIQRTQADIQSTMFKHLQGTEPGLVAYYDFNNINVDTVPDVSGNSNKGVLLGSGGSFTTSYAAIGDDSMYNMNSVHAIWYSIDTNSYNYGITTNGLNILGNIKPRHGDYAVFGCDTTAGGTSMAYLPVAAPAGFTRLNREWLFNVGGNVQANNMIFNLSKAAGTGTALSNGYAAGDYTLLSRTSTTQPFTAIASGTSISGSIVQFANVPLQDHTYYTIGVSSTNLHLGSNNVTKTLTPVSIYPNPAQSTVFITNATGAQINIYDNLGRLIKSIKQDNPIYKIDISDMANGMYYIQMLNDNNITEQKLIIQK